jgi:hypothetical protein
MRTIINPLGRYHYAKRRLAKPFAPDWARIVEFHDIGRTRVTWLMVAQRFCLSAASLS